jgi:uncharacterized integral membrane protein
MTHEPVGDTSTTETSALRGVRRRVNWTLVSILVALVLFVLLLVFILENLGQVSVRFLWMDGSLPLAVAMLFSAVAGAAVVALVGGARILRLRRKHWGRVRGSGRLSPEGANGRPSDAP